MKLKVFTLTKVDKGSRDVPLQFHEQVRPDIIKRAFEVIRSNQRQPYGADPMAGKKHSTAISRRRRKYRGSYGHGISRVPRKILTRRGTRFFWVGAMAPGTVGGRRAHPPKADKIWAKKINTKERRKAIRSAMAATLAKGLVQKRGHSVPAEYPFIIEQKIETLQKTKDVRAALEKLGLKEDLTRSLARTLRGGIAKLRGRKYRVPKGPLLVVANDCALLKSASNIPGVDVVKVSNLNVELLAPGAEYGRLTLFTEGAMERLDKEKLFIHMVKKGATKEKAKEKKEVKKKAVKKKATKKKAVKKPAKKAKKAKK
jgi:large subunit ribosomal protein L4e